MLCDSINANFTFIVWQRKYKTCHSKQHDSKKKHICFLDSEALPIVWLKILTQEYSNMGLYLLDRIDETSVTNIAIFLLFGTLECQNSIILYFINENKTFFQHVFRHKMEENVIANLFAWMTCTWRTKSNMSYTFYPL